jgi:parallel beta-helix repeat protein
MIKRILAGWILIFCSVNLVAQQGLQKQPEIALLKGMKISRSVKIKKAIYKLDAPADTSRPVILIEGNNITIDFNNADLRGSNQHKNPDEFFGIAILVRNSRNVTIKNLKARGYKVALLARNTEKLTLDNCDLSYNYRPHLNSSQEKEDVSDWMSYHQNEKDEWLRYGAAIYLRSCNFATITNCKVTGGQNALMMTSCNDGMIYNNDFSFNSGIGIGMYRSSRNNIMYNRVIFNVRGYSHGVYNRGQDSAGILIYEQSNKNLFYKNNVTHGGDGFFLWAGQTTMDSGGGGCNDNIITGNDFSYAPANGVEATFSRNEILSNRIFECDHGIWGGYSYDTRISGNQFRNNRVAIAIEHGQHNRIHNNLFIKDKEAIRLWSRAQQPSDWGYAKYHDTRSADYAIVSNSFNDIPLVYNFTRTDSIYLFNNPLSYTIGQVFKTDSTVTNLDTAYSEKWDEFFQSAADFAVPMIDKANDPFAGSGKLAGRKNILITEWGPYDFRSPVIWNTNPVDQSDTMKFDLIGPRGKWIIKTVRGVKNISMMKGEFPGSITAIKQKGERTDILIELEYTGAELVTPFGETITAGKLYKFYFRQFFQPLNWEVLFYSLDTAHFNPIKTNMLFSPLERKAPVKTEKVNKLDYAWWGGINANNNQYVQFLTIAEAQAVIPKGSYELSVTWDDAVRVYVDNKMVIDEWNPSLYKFDESPHKKIRLNLGGNHQFRVEHVELGGFATLNLKIRPI